MICFPNAKINLGLNVVGRRQDGYHDIETIFYPVPVRDALEVVESETFSFRQSGIPVDAPLEKNLVMRAMNLIEARYSLPALGVHLLKEIPFGAGLGGGSSDGAYMLKLLNDFCRLGIPTDELEQMAAELGADCPFFIQNQPVFASGTGNVFEKVTLSLRGYYLCLVKPDVAVSTSDAYGMITPRRPEVSLREIAERPVRDWRGVMANDFEACVFPVYPLIEEVKEALYEAGALYASMTGSGSSVFGLFDKAIDLRKRFPSFFVWEGVLP
ncbi:MAG: 4-(cytidine 5'-diphospho)-2-C-methyl-D-erythritol kinase [Tannerellaceae bacterium]|jgi:4-diphosphocytidyl-2-C-methyl-D-erythritol kinase|nr:4-(cytidine 5'-diphospho)-2-C-methyl-D-erythritol kinase [Tannerellaceae bacterium]